ncbi:MAG: hypothetical protein ABIO21_19130, partial [Pseudomonas sp.]
MPWQTLLNRRERLPANADLGEGFATLLHQLGTVTPFELAVAGARVMATPGLAFLVGYQAALRVLWPSAPQSLVALCATEQRSLRPADMQTRLKDLRLNGRKDFVTAGDAADYPRQNVHKCRHPASRRPLRTTRARIGGRPHDQGRSKFPAAQRGLLEKSRGAIGL